jgi:hypothetical protein
MNHNPYNIALVASMTYNLMYVLKPVSIET